MLLRLRNNRPLYYFSLLALFLALLELLFSYQSVLFSSTTDRISLKSAMFEYKNKTEVLFLGSSRFKDGISPDIFSEQIKKETSLELNGFNGAITGANIERLEFFFNKAVKKPGIKYVFIEISHPQLKRKQTDIEAEKKENDFDTKLSNFFAKNSSLISYRKSLRFDNLKNIPFIIFSDYIDGSNLYRKGGVSGFFKDSKTKINSEKTDKWKPLIITPTPNITFLKETDLILKVFQNITLKAEQEGVEIIFVMPPLEKISSEIENKDELIKMYQKLSNITGKKIYNYSDLKVAKNMFRDGSHLNEKGRYVFSIMLAKLLTTEIIKK